MASVAAGFASLSVSELKTILNERGIDHSKCIEKDELVALCNQSSAGSEMRLAKVSQPGKFHDIEQGTKGWTFIRRGPYDVRVGGSEIGDILNVSGFAKPLAVYQKIIAQRYGNWEQDEETPAPCAHGHLCEPLIADMYSRAMDTELLDGGYYSHPDDVLGEFYGASPDRRILNKRGEIIGLLEIKAPYLHMATSIKPGYMAQMQYQMWCSGLPFCDFIAVKLDHNTPEKTIPSRTRVYLARVYRDTDYIAWMIPRLFYFSTCLALERPPPRDLFENEAMGLVPPPKPRVEETIVETGAEKWCVRPLEKKKRKATDDPAGSNESKRARLDEE